MVPVLLISALMACGCTERSKIPADTLVVALSAEPATLDPRFATDAVGMRITSLIFNSLVRLGPNLEPVPEAAEKWTVKGDTYTFFLRKDLRFHNGRALNKDDVEFSFATVLSPGSPFSSIKDIVKGVTVSEVKDQLLVAVQLKNFSDKFLKADLPSVKLLPKAEVLSAGLEFSNSLVGTGGFRLVRQNMNEIELEGVHATTKHLIFKIIHDDFTRYQKMLKGEVDIVQMEISPDRIADFQKRPQEFQVFLYPGLSMTYILIGFHDPILSKMEVRQALAQSIQRDDLIRYKMHGMASEATSILTPQNPYFNAQLKNFPWDPGKARRAIEKLGLLGHELILKTSNSPGSIDNGKVLAYQMSQSGIKVRVQSYEWGTFYSDIKRGDFQLATMKWVGTVDPDIYKLAFHSREFPPGRNRGFYNNARLDSLLEAGTGEANVPKRRKIFNEVQEIIHSDLAIIPLWYDQQVAIVKKSVIGYHPSQTGDYWPLLEASKAHD